jgi:MFS superfamily sulfate permease-like transporter
LAKGKYQFIPFIALVAVVTTDLLKGVLLGIVISIIFYTKGEFKKFFKKEEYVDGDIIHIDLAQVF